MKYGVIDVGSNSVRLMMSSDGKTIYKRIEITKLAQGLADSFFLNAQAIERTALAVSKFYDLAKSEKADKVYVFATAAVRQAVNGQDFVLRVKKLCGLEVDVISGENEALIGALGALNGKDGGVIDVGGASAEIIVINGGKAVYSKSIEIGAVKLFELFNDNEERLSEYIQNKLKSYGNVPKADFVCIGGTATSVASVLQQLKHYDPCKVDGYRIARECLGFLADKLIGMSIEDRKSLFGLQPERAEVIASGVVLLHKIINFLDVNSVIVSEKDNLEGYLKLKTEKI